MEKTLFQNLLSIISQFRLRLIIAVFLLCLSNFLLILNPLIFRQALLFLTPQTTEVQGKFSELFRNLLGPYLYSVYVWAAILLGVAFVSSILKYYMRTIFIVISREVEEQLRIKLFDRIEKQSHAFFDRYGIGDLLSRLTNDMTAYRDLIGPGLMYPIFSFTLIFPAVVTLFNLSIPLALISLFPIFGVYTINLLFRRPLFRFSEAVQESLAKMSVMAHEHFSGIRIIKSYVIEKETFQLFKKLCHSFQYLSFRFNCLKDLVFPLLSLINKITTLTLVFLAGVLILKELGTLNLADFLSFMWIQSYIFTPLLLLGWILPMYQKGSAAYLRLVHIYDEPLEVFENTAPIRHIPSNADICFKGLSFFYPGQSKPALSHIHLHIKAGTFIGITGPVGSGKTTLFRLLNREYEVPKGQIYIGEREIHDFSLEAFHQGMVTVEQVPFLFSKTIADNMRFGNYEASQEEIEMVARQADLHDSIIEFPEQYSTMVGERGVSLSGGQKQRVAVARAFLVNRSILLLDDIFSAVDVATEHRIFEAMKKNFAGKTLLLITHRVSILEQLNRVIYMVDGQILEEGSPQELTKMNGKYAALVDLQKLNL